MTEEPTTGGQRVEGGGLTNEAGAGHGESRTPPVEVVCAAFKAGASVRQVADEWGCTPRTVRNVAHRGGVALPARRSSRRVAAPKRPPKYPALYEPGWLAERLAAGCTLGAVAGEVGCSITAVRVAVRELGIVERRGHSEVRFPELHRRRWVKSRYVTHGRSVAEIAGELGASETSVYRALDAFGLPRVPRRKLKPPAARLLADWRLFGQVATIARLHGVGAALAEAWLAEAGVLVRDRPAIPPNELREAVAAGHSHRVIAKRYSLDARVVRVELCRLAVLDA